VCACWIKCANEKKQLDDAWMEQLIVVITMVTLKLCTNCKLQCRLLICLFNCT